MAQRSTEPVQLVLERVATRWSNIAREIERVTESLLGVAGAQTVKSLVPNLEASLAQLDAAVKRIAEAAEQPEVVIATTGTTSSGKSTLANFLIGAELLPKAVQEMSAGVVSVRHSPGDRTLSIAETRGARWPTGVWSVLTAEQIRTRLESTMQAYRELVAEDSSGVRSLVDPPMFEISWPTRMGEHASEFGLPSAARLKIVDLPGLKFVNDKLNGDVVQEQARKALCIVAYNSEETDPRKQDALLDQVVDQVKALRGSPARMLFVLNRIDAYRRDRDPVASEREFTDRVTRKIRQKVSDSLPEYASEANGIEPMPLSSEPGLYAVLAEAAGVGNDLEILQRLARQYATVFPEDKMDSLPRKAGEWTEAQRRSFLQEARYQARVETFEKRLGAHIAQNLPEILFPDLVDGAYAQAASIVRGLDAFVEAYSLRERTDAIAAKQRLEALHKRLKALQKGAVASLSPLAEAARGGDGLAVNLAAAVPAVERELGLATADGGAGKLAALQSAMNDAVGVPLSRVNDHLFRFMSGEVVDDSPIFTATAGESLIASLQVLRASAYGASWSEGGRFEPPESERILDALKSFAEQLSSTATELVQRETAIQADRMVAALHACEDAVTARLEGAAASAFEENDFQALRGVFRGRFDVAAPVVSEVRFQADFSRWSSVEQRLEDEVYWYDKRVWWKLWLGTSREQGTRQVVKSVNREGVEVDRFGSVLKGFIDSADVRALEHAIASWLQQALRKFEEGLEARLREGVKIYRQTLECRMDEIEQGVQLRVDSAESHRKELIRLASSVELARQWRRITDG